MNTKTQLTKDGLNELKKELLDLKKVKLKQVKVRMDEARKAGDLSENSAWNMAQEEYENILARIDEIELILKNATTITGCSTNKVVIGSTVTINMEGKPIKFQLVSPEEANPNNGRMSFDSPLGKAIVGKRRGEKAQYIAPNGKTIEINIENIECE